MLKLVVKLEYQDILKLEIIEIGGGSGVIRDIPDNTKVMGYPAKNIREFLRDKR